MRSENAAALRVVVIIGSTREGRLGDTIGDWFVEQARRRADIDPSTVDLAGFDFPASYPLVASDGMLDFVQRIERADGFVVVTPEYNRSFPASLKQAIDYAYDEWHAKPVGFVSYGCRSTGLYAVEQLRAVFTELHVVTMRDSVSFNLLDGDVDDTGAPLEAATRGRLGQAVNTMLDQLVWWGRALRAARPYIC
ncbi:MAG: NADPH-dependent oxidoreductase [Pseudonocardiaceae bacterium]|nr:NADPH-dependent oxidoreductase [Pseudonocardiaceae bacterium]